jgi:hypothetical protein
LTPDTQRQELAWEQEFPVLLVDVLEAGDIYEAVFVFE